VGGYLPYTEPVPKPQNMVRSSWCRK